MSITPLSGSTSASSRMPPCSRPTLPTSTLRAWRRRGGSSSMWISTRIDRSRRCLTAETTYAAGPIRAFSRVDASSIIAASNPIPAITANHLAVDLPDVQPPPAAVHRQPDSGDGIVGQAQIHGQQICRYRRAAPPTRSRSRRARPSPRARCRHLRRRRPPLRPARPLDGPARCRDRPRWSPTTSAPASRPRHRRLDQPPTLRQVFHPDRIGHHRRAQRRDRGVAGLAARVSSASPWTSRPPGNTNRPTTCSGTLPRGSSRSRAPTCPATHVRWLS